MRWILDSNVWIESAAGITHAVNVLTKAATGGDGAVSRQITRLEILGFPHLTQQELNSDLFNLLCRFFHEVPVSSAVIDRAVHLRESRSK